LNPCTSHVQGFGCLGGQEIIEFENKIAGKIPGTEITRKFTRYHSHISVTDVAKHAENCMKNWNENVSIWSKEV